MSTLTNNLTAELTRRREFIQASPDQSSYETRSRRSRPTICSTAFRIMNARVYTVHIAKLSWRSGIIKSPLRNSKFHPSAFILHSCFFNPAKFPRTLSGW